jgi:methionyl aminopeptidase
MAMMTRVKTLQEIGYMRESGRMLATVLNLIKSQVKPGVTTKQLADAAAKELKKLGGKPAFLGYQGYPAVLCVSVNDEVVHGIPRPSRVIKDGDIVSLDFGVDYRGMITDAAISVIAGKGTAQNKKLVETTQKALFAGVDILKDGARVGDISDAIQQVLDKGNYGIVRDLVGHGVGHALHEDPNIPNYGSKNEGPILKAGMTIAIEPMATLGDYGVTVDKDGWTVRTKDKSWAAHFEHTVLITQDGAEVLTTL